LFGAAIAAVVTGGVFTVIALDKENTALDLEKRAAQGNISLAQQREHETALDQRNRYRAIGVGAFAGGAALAVTGTLLFVLDNPEPEITPTFGSPRTSPKKERSEVELSLGPFGSRF
jgi:hypothetical protein